MKTALYVEDGVVQIVLTPETEWEKSIVAKMPGAVRNYHDGFHNTQPIDAVITRGSFYSCRGGWHRQGDGDDSLIVRITPQAQPEPSHD